MQKHKWAEHIKAWADGAEIEYRNFGGNHWNLIDRPVWDGEGDYRVKSTHNWQHILDAQAKGKKIQARFPRDYVEGGWSQWNTGKYNCDSEDAEYRIAPNVYSVALFSWRDNINNEKSYYTISYDNDENKHHDTLDNFVEWLVFEKEYEV